MADIQIAHDRNAVELVQAQTERFGKQVDLRIKNMDMGHRHLKEAIETGHKGMELHHKMNQSQQQGA